MTNLNESLAIFMGWEKYVGEPGTKYPFWREGHEHRCDVSTWKPTEDLNQASLVIKKLGEMGLQAEFAEHLAAIIMPHDYKADGPAMFFTPWAAYELVAATAAQRMQAAYKVIKGGEA